MSVRAPVSQVEREPPVREVPASIGQRLLWLMDRHRGGGPALNERLVWRVRGRLDPGVLQRALDELAARHEALRTTFGGRGRSLTQRVHAAGAVELALERVTPADVDGAVAAEAERPLDLERAPLRARLLALGSEDWIVFVTVHHLVTDFASNAILAQDLAALYERCASAETGAGAMDPVRWQYADWCESQRESFAAGRLAELQAFWSRRLDGAQFVALPFTEGAARSLSGRAYERRQLGERTAAALDRAARENGAERFAVALAAFYVHLHALTGQSDLALASLFANRGRAEVARTVGFFVNMLVMRGVVDPGLRFAELVRETQEAVKASAAHQDLPYQMLAPNTVAVQTVQGPRRADDVVFQYIEGEPRPAAHARIAGLTMTPLEREWRRSRFALELFVAYDEHRVTPILVYDTGRLDDAFARRFADGYQAALTALEDGADAPVSQIVARCSDATRRSDRA